MKEKVYELTFGGKKHQIILGKTTYCNNNSIAVVMLERMKDGTEGECGVLTVNLSDQIVPADETSAYIDTNNLGEKIIKWLTKNGIAHITPFLGFSGYCVYPYVTFTKEALLSMKTL